MRGFAPTTTSEPQRPANARVPMRSQKRWAVFISGRGSNLAALLESKNEIDVILVVSSSAKAYGLLRAKRAGVQTAVFPRLLGTSKLDWAAIERTLARFGITHVFLAGFMRIVPPEFLMNWKGRVLNLHPSLLPAYPGLESIERAHEDRAAMGATVHEVVEEVDAGRIVCQRCSLNESEVSEYLLASAEFLVHVDEQRLVKEAIRRWIDDPSCESALEENESAPSAPEPLPRKGT